MRCYCSLCRKTSGAGGFAINTEADHATLEVSGKEHVRAFRAEIAGPGGKGRTLSPLERHFCSLCGSHLWVWDPRWPALCHPFAGAIDTALDPPESATHIMLASKASWATADIGEDDDAFDEYPDYSLAEWHEERGLEED
jgi:hypothetical protein